RNDQPRLEGRVLGPDGRGIEGAVVALDSPGSRVSTTAEGRFSFDHLERATYAVFASAGEWSAGPVHHAISDPPRPLILRLAPGALKTVAVVDEAGLPIADASVQVVVGGWTSTTQAAAGGRVRLGPLPRSYWYIAADAPGHAPAAQWASPAEDDVTIVLVGGSPLSGRIIDESGQPIAGARVTALPYYHEPGTTPVRSNDRGEFTIPALAPGHYTLLAVDDEHAPTHLSKKVAGGPVGDLEIVMKAPGLITGVVLDRDRRPVPLATVSSRQPDGMRRATTDENGAFELRNLERFGAALRAETTVAASDDLIVDLSRQPDADVELVLDVAGAIEGTVVDERGAPLAGISVAAVPDFEHLPPQRRSYLPGDDTTSDSDGRFAFHRLPDLPYLLDARWPTSSFDRSPQVTVARPGDHDVRITLLPGGDLAGRVIVNHADAAPAGVMLRIGPRAATHANRDGSFHIRDVPPGTYDVWFHSPEFTDFTAHVEIRSRATTDLGTLTASSGRMLVGRVVDASGAPVGGARIEVGVIRPDPIDEDDPVGGFHAYCSGVAARDGAFRVTGVPPTPMIIIASDAAGRRSEAIALPGNPPGSLEVPDDPPPFTIVMRRADER
ncbi:MAG TPA: carboxypeptidase regulatory-like domain-containing protein, partial [Kofleriaceae bacterium]